MRDPNDPDDPDAEGLALVADALAWLDSLVRADPAVPAGRRTAAVQTAMRAFADIAAARERVERAGIARLREAGLSWAQVARTMGMRSKTTAETRWLALTAPPAYGEPDGIRARAARARQARRTTAVRPAAPQAAASRLVAAALALVDARELLALDAADEHLDDLAVLLADRDRLTAAGHGAVAAYTALVLREARAAVAAGAAVTSDRARRTLLAAERAAAAFHAETRARAAP